eukprot:1159924-Pelagomonas_calceolata.AAC.11
MAMNSGRGWKPQDRKLADMARMPCVWGPVPTHYVSCEWMHLNNASMKMALNLGRGWKPQDRMLVDTAGMPYEKHWNMTLRQKSGNLPTWHGCPATGDQLE